MFWQEPIPMFASNLSFSKAVIAERRAKAQRDGAPKRFVRLPAGPASTRQSARKEF
jgi:hypothetical protein